MKINTFIAGICLGIMFTYYLNVLFESSFNIYHLFLFVLGVVTILLNLYCDREETNINKINRLQEKIIKITKLKDVKK